MRVQAQVESVIRFIFDSIGSPISAKKIADTMVSSGRKTDSKTIEKYISALQNCFIVYEAKRYDVKGKLHGDFVYEVRIDGYLTFFENSNSKIIICSFFPFR